MAENKKARRLVGQTGQRKVAKMDFSRLCDDRYWASTLGPTAEQPGTFVQQLAICHLAGELRAFGIDRETAWQMARRDILPHARKAGVT